MPAARSSSPSLFGLLLRALLELGWIVLLIGLPSQLPALPAFAGWCLLLAGEWACDRWRGGVPYRLQQALFFWMVGCVIAIGRLPDSLWLGLPVALLAAGLALHLQTRWERRLHLLQRSPSEPADDDSNSNASAWGRDAPLLTPEGQAVRCLNTGEIAMGGPLVCDYLLPDGSLIENANPTACFSSDGRYFVSPMPSRNAWGLLIYDREQRLLHHSRCSDFWEIDHVSASEVHGRPDSSNSAQRASLATLISQAECTALRPLGDLWLREALWQHYHDTLQSQNLSAAHTPHQLLANAYLPASLQALDDPLAALHNPSFALQLDGVDCALFISGTTNRLAWREDGEALVALAAQTPGGASAYWYWHAEHGWQRLGEPWQRLPREPYGSADAPLGLNTTHARIAVELAQPSLGYGNPYGEFNSYTHASLTLISQQAADGRPRTHEAAQPQLELLLPLDGRGGRRACLLQSAALGSGQRAMWQWLHDTPNNERGAYAVRLGDWQLPGEWSLDHRLSDCGRYLALLSHENADAPARLAIIEPAQHRLEWLSGDLADMHLQGFIDGQIHLIHLLGLRQAHTFVPGTVPPLPYHVDQPLPAKPSDWGAFIRQAADMIRFYKQARIAYNGHVWQCQSVRLAHEPPAAWQQSDFIVPAPNHADRAWAFGFSAAQVYVDDDWRELARDGYLLTDSGIALTRLAAPMIWSSDSRYLALLRHIERFRDATLEHDQWRLLLLDTQQRSLRQYTADMGLWPRFESFDGTLRYSNLNEDAQPQHHIIDLEALLQTTAQPLKQQAGRWLEAEECQRAHSWATLTLPHSDQ